MLFRRGTPWEGHPALPRSVLLLFLIAAIQFQANQATLDEIAPNDA